MSWRLIPGASRTVPFVSKATGLNLVRVAARVMVGKSLESQGVTTEPTPTYVSVKEAVFPFAKFPGVDIVLGPEMGARPERSWALTPTSHQPSPRANSHPAGCHRAVPSLSVSLSETARPLSQYHAGFP